VLHVDLYEFVDYTAVELRELLGAAQWGNFKNIGLELCCCCSCVYCYTSPLGKTCRANHRPRAKSTNI
jgi:hypothetical protein